MEARRAREARDGKAYIVGSRDGLRGKDDVRVLVKEVRVFKGI